MTDDDDVPRVTEDDFAALEKIRVKVEAVRALREWRYARDKGRLAGTVELSDEYANALMRWIRLQEAASDELETPTLGGTKGRGR